MQGGFCSLCNEDGCTIITRCNHNFHKFCLLYFGDEFEPDRCPVCNGPISHNSDLETLIREAKNNGKIDFEGLKDYEKKAVIKSFLYDNSTSVHQILSTAIETSSLRSFTLNEAVANGHLEALKWIIKWYQVNGYKWESVELLERSCESGDRKIVDYVLSLGVNINVKDVSIFDKVVQSLKNFLDEKISQDIKAQNNILTKFILEFKEDCELISKLINIGFDVNDGDEEGVTPFLAACSVSNVEILTELIKNGAKTRTLDNDGKNAFHYAARNSNYPEVVDFLWSLNIQLNEEKYPVLDEVDYSKKNSDVVVESLIKIGANSHGSMPLLLACDYENVKCVKVLVENGASLKGSQRGNAWFYACSRANIEIIKLFIEKGYDIEERFERKDNMTGLLLVCFYHGSPADKVAAFKLLVDAGADSKAVDETGRNAFHLALTSYNLSAQLIEYLLSLGFDPKSVDKEGNISMHRLIYGLNQHGFNRWADCPDGALKVHRDKTMEIAMKFVDKVDLNVANLKGEYPIHLLCEFSHVDLLEFLVKSGADVNATDAEGRTVAHLICKYYDKRALRFLEKAIELGVDLNIRDRENKLAVDYCRCDEMIKLIKMSA